MLQHSKSSTGQKEPTDINALAEKYLRLAYHGLRAKDKSFKATINTEFDESYGIVAIVSKRSGEYYSTSSQMLFMTVLNEVEALSMKRNKKA